MKTRKTTPGLPPRRRHARVAALEKAWLGLAGLGRSAERVGEGAVRGGGDDVEVQPVHGHEVARHAHPPVVLEDVQQKGPRDLHEDEGVHREGHERQQLAARHGARLEVELPVE